ncbi:MAG: hypothetical protein AABW54_02625 [Candidatus Micrarchaeota archaeon]
MQAYEIEYEPGWDKYFTKLDQSVQERILNKIVQLQTGIQSRHLKHGLPYFVEEIGAYRLVYAEEEPRMRVIIFAGSHKDYEKWFKSQ